MTTATISASAASTLNQAQVDQLQARLQAFASSAIANAASKFTFVANFDASSE